MGMIRPEQNMIKAMALPFGAGAAAAVATMFVPTAMLESFTGATGLSEIVPATAAPLGDTARALIAFGTGVLTIALVAMLNNRKGKAMARTNQAIKESEHNISAKSGEETPSLLHKIRDGLDKIGRDGISFPKMPWAKSADSAQDDGKIYDLRDLPKLRTADVHPDAPARRPILASSDIDMGLSQMDVAPSFAKKPVELPKDDLKFWGDDDGDFGRDDPPLHAKPSWALEEQPQPDFAPRAATPEIYVPSMAAPIAPPVAPAIVVPPAPVGVAPAAPVYAPEPVSAATSSLPSSDFGALLAKLETAMETRTTLLNKLQDNVAAIVATPSVAAPIESPIPSLVQDMRPPLEAVPMSPQAAAQPEQMDDALRAALETLHRMNAQAR